MVKWLMHDSHIHLAMEPLRNNYIDSIDAFLRDNGKYILTQGTDIVDFDENFQIAEETNKLYPNTIQVAIGLHPTFFEEITLALGIVEDVFEKCQKKMILFEDIFNKKKEKVSAIGECGLDYYQFSLNNEYTKEQKEQLKEIQKIMLRNEIQLAVENSLPMSIHSRDVNGSKECLQDAIRIIAEEGKGTLKGSFHSYTGDISQLNQIIDLGFHVGFNSIITYKSGNTVREILKKTPLDRILFETDGPFLPPQSVRKNKKIKEKFAQPKDIREIMEVACQVKNLSMEKLEKVTDENYRNLFT
jgi:TatD DNase family protein